MKPKDIKNLQIGKTLQRVAVGESLTVTTADGSVVIAKAATPIKNADVAFQKIADGTWVAFDFKQDQMTSRNEKIDIRRTKPTIRETVTSPQYKVKGLVKFTDNKIYKGGDGVIVYLDQSIDTLVKFFSTGSGSLDYLAYWRKGDDLVFDAAGQKTIIPAWFAPPYGYDKVIDGPVYFTYDIEMPFDYYIREFRNFPVSNINESFQRAYPVYYTILGEIFEAVATQNYSIVQTSASLLMNLEMSWTMDIVLPGIPPLTNLCNYTETKTGSASATTATTFFEAAINTELKLPVWIGDKFMIVREQNIQCQITETRNGYRSSSNQWLLADMTTYSNTNSLDWSLPSQTGIEQSGANTYSFINTNTLDTTTINTNSLVFYFRDRDDNILFGTNVGDTLNITYEDFLARRGITDISVADIINEERYHAFPYTAGETFEYFVPTEATITETPDFETAFEREFLESGQYSATTSYSNTAFTVFWDNMQGKVFDIYYKEAGTCYILETALSFDYIDYDYGNRKRRFLTNITGTVTAKRECNGGMAKQMLEDVYIGSDWNAIAISQDNYWNYIWTLISSTFVDGNKIVWNTSSKMNGFLRDDQLRLAFTQSPSQEKITQEHTSYTELFALLPDGRFVRLGEEESPVSAMALGTPNDPGFWSYYSQ